MSQLGLKKSNIAFFDNQLLVLLKKKNEKKKSNIVGWQQPRTALIICIFLR